MCAGAQGVANAGGVPRRARTGRCGADFCRSSVRASLAMGSACSCGTKVGVDDDSGIKDRLVRQSGADNPLVHSLSTAQLLEIHEAFAKFDRDGDGHIEAKELATVMRIMGMEPTENQLQELIRSVDVDGNNKIELEEFANLMARRILMHDGKVELEQAFKLFDSDQSGYVTADEIRSLMMGAGGDEALTSSEVEELIKMADPDRDGKISFEEFKDMECWKIPEESMRPVRTTPRRQSNPGGP